MSKHTPGSWSVTYATDGMDEPTARQLERLGRLIASLEALQNEIPESDTRDRIGKAKSELIHALNVAEGRP